MTRRVWPQVQPTFFSICSLDFKGICALFYGLHSERGRIQKTNQTTSYLSAASFLTNDFILEPLGVSPRAYYSVSIVREGNHNIAFIFYFYACWTLYKRNIFLMFPGRSELDIHNDWNRGWIPKPSSFKSTGSHATYGSKRNRSQDICVTSRDWSPLPEHWE